MWKSQSNQQHPHCFFPILKSVQLIPKINYSLINLLSTKMSLRSPTFLMGLANLFAIGGATYHLRSHHIYNLEEHEARMDELEGTLRGHIGLIEESLERLEGKQITKGQKT